MKARLRVIIAMIKKELKISFRFPKNFIASQIMNPLRLLISFWLVYQSFFVVTNNQSIGIWNRMNYVPTLLIGTIFHTSSINAFNRFRGQFLNEKYWGTIQLLLTSPVSKADFLFASSMALVVEIAIPLAIYLFLLHAYQALTLSTLLLVLITLYLMVFGMLGLSLIQGAFAISNENYLFIFDYVLAGIVCFSCFYYSASAVPEALRFFVKINPIYHAVEIARGSVLQHASFGQNLFSLLYLLAFAIFTPYGGAIFFRKVVRELGIRGF